MIHGGAPSQGGAFPSQSSFFDLDRSDLGEDQRGPGPSLCLSLGLHHSELSLSPLWKQVGHPGGRNSFAGGSSLSESIYLPQTLNQCLSEVLAHRRGSGNANGVDGQTSMSLCAAPLSLSHHLSCPHHISFLSLSLASPISSHLPFRPGVSPEACRPTIPIARN